MQLGIGRPNVARPCHRHWSRRHVQLRTASLHMPSGQCAMNVILNRTNLRKCRLSGNSITSSGCCCTARVSSRHLRSKLGAAASGHAVGLNSSTSQTGNEQQVAAMALSPFAALSLQATQAKDFSTSVKDFLEPIVENVEEQYYGIKSSIGNHLHEFASTRQGQRLADEVDKGLMYMEWTYDWLGIDFSYIWDPELYYYFTHDQAKFFQRLAEKVIYYAELPAPPLHDMRLSYTKFLQLLHQHQIKRIIVLGDMRTAIVEVPQMASNLGWSVDLPDSPTGNVLINADALDDPSQWYAPELPEWDMVKYRFYLDLPGNFWEEGHLMRYLKQRFVRTYWDPEEQQYIRPFEDYTKVGEARTELTILDPKDSWTFAQFLLAESGIEGLLGVVALSLACSALMLLEDVWYKLLEPVLAEGWDRARALGVKLLPKNKKKKKPEETLMEAMGRSSARVFNVATEEGGAVKRTSVTFADVAGLDKIVYELREITKLLLEDPGYVELGARAPRGILFQGPPGTGKTYLARAMAGEANIPFLSCNGAEFVEMFQGIAQLRVQSLFNTARSLAPCIIFIDEIDAIGKSRTYNTDDPGAVERETALLEMLVQMDGINGPMGRVIIIGATNMVDELDAALLRPGRFEVIFNINVPSPSTRLAILMYHARNKPIPDPERLPMLRKVAAITDQWSAASLANLLNEAAIITVRNNVDSITLPLLLEIVDNYEHGEPVPRLPASEAKNRMALTTAGKAVAFALTPGVDEIKYATIWPQKEYMTAVEFKPDLLGNVDTSVRGWETNVKSNASYIGDHRLGEFYHLCLLLSPLYAQRAVEVVFFGPDAVTLSTADPLPDAFEIAYYCVRLSGLHPRFSRMPPIHHYMYFGKEQDVPDPATEYLDIELNYHKLAVTLLQAAWQRTLRMVTQRRSAIVKVAEAMLADERETVRGEDIVRLLESTPLDEADGVVVESDFMELVEQALGEVPGVMRRGADAAGQVTFDVFERGSVGAVGRSQTGGPMLQVSFTRREVPVLSISPQEARDVARAVMGRLDMADLIGRNTAKEVAERARDALIDPETLERLKAIRRYAEGDGDFPPAPLSRDVHLPVYGAVQMDLDWWKTRRINPVTWSAAEMLYSERQMQYYRQDMDVAGQGPRKGAPPALTKGKAQT